MPIIAIGGALIAGAIAAPAVGALIGGATLASIGIGGVLEITAAVGATLGAVGSITRDKGLQTAGLVIGGIGGIGSLASAAGLIDGSTALFGGAGAAAGAAATDASGLSNLDQAITASESVGAGGLSASEAAAAGLPAGAMSPEGFAENDIVGSIMRATQTPAAELDAAAGMEATPPNLMQQASVNANSPPSSMMSQAAQGANAPNGGFQTPYAAEEAASGGVPYIDVTKSGVGFAEPGVVNGIMGFAKDNPLVSYGLVQAAASGVSGMFSTLTPAQVAQANAVAANNRAQAALTAQQASNMQSGVPGVTRIPAQVRGAVTGAPNPNGTGLINTANPSAYAVTGVPA